MNVAPTLIIGLDRIDVPPGRVREADPAKVDEVAVSLSEIGLLQPIEVRPTGDAGRYSLVFGLHRLLGAKAAGWTEIEARSFAGTELQARMREIDENLYRAELTPYDQAAHLAERRKIYEALNGPVKAGRRRNGAKLAQLSFFDDVTGKFGLPPRTIKRALFRWNRIEREVWEQIRGTPLAKNGAQLDALAKLLAVEQAKVAELLVQGEAKNVVDALKKVRGVHVRIDPDQKQFQKLQTVWSDAGTVARKRFLELLRDEGLVTLPASRGRK